MALVDPVFGIKIVILLGFANVFFMLLILATCRCTVAFDFAKGLLDRSWFKRLYAWHCYYWYAFILSVLLHAVLALDLYGSAF
ncbi:MAG: hypothetical protein ACE5DI_03190 [Candidatus Micrarchaeia archaeon]